MIQQTLLSRVIAKILCITLSCVGFTPVIQAQPAGPRNLAVESAAGIAVNRGQKLALIVGNSSYSDAPLANPANDARAMAGALKDLGFTVIARENADLKSMNAAVREFGDKLRAGGVGVFYYAGHGMQIKGNNYLIPVGSNIEREDEVAYGAIDAQSILDKMDSAGNGNNFMILDACRNNPFIRNTRSGKGGLSQMDAPVGTLVSFATSPGAVASDGTGANGLYTTHLLDALKQPGLKAEEVFKRVRAAVRRDSKGAQVPWEATSLEGDFYFRPPVQMAQATQPNAAPVTIASPAAVSMAAPTAASTNKPSPLIAAPQTSPGLSAVDQQRINQDAAAAIANFKPTVAAQSQHPLTPAQDQAISAAIDAMVQQRIETANEASVALATRPDKAPPASNAFGFTVGDTWRYQTVDKWKKEVTGNWSRRIDAINSDGSLKLNGGSVVWEADGAIRSYPGGDKRVRVFSPAVQTRVKLLQVGYAEPNSLKVAFTIDGAPSGRESQDAKIKVIKQEAVTVPAGTFTAWKIERSGFTDGVSSSGGNYTRRFTETSWYVPALKTYVASEYESWRGSTLDTQTRQELTSYSVRGADQALAQNK
jgi:hypothetical protein